MDLFYAVIFGFMAVVAAGFEFFKPSESQAVNARKDFVAFRMNYVIVYSLMMAGDWLQGPYVYALYSHYGFDRAAIGQLFIAGFGSSLLFGTLVGSLADVSGRKKAALTYVATYTIGCCTKHFNNYWILMLGRFFCGIATSLLYSAFESWLVAEHFKRGFEASWLGTTFSKAVFFGNGLMAIVAGLFAQMLVGQFDLGPVAPFDAAALVMLIGGLLVLFTWSENFGESSAKEASSLKDQATKAARAIIADPKIAMLGAMQSLFEGSMYTFVFLWTPALSARGETLPHGMIFSCFMVSSMAGSALAGILLSSNSKIRVERYMQAVYAVSALCLFVPVFYHLSVNEPVTKGITGLSGASQIQLVAFCGFEFMVGLFWPSMMKMRSQHVPEEIRSTIINFFRIPLNIFVCLVLYHVGSFPLSVMFGMCSAFLLVCAVCQRRLDDLVRQHGYTAVSPQPEIVAESKKGIEGM